MVTTILATLLVSYLGQYGPMKPPSLRNPIDLLVMIAIGLASFAWSVRAGGPTEELTEILAAQKEEPSPAKTAGS